MTRLLVAALTAVLLAFSPMASAQGLQTGVITGIVQSTDDLSLPGVTVTVASPALQGVRTAVTDINGVYIVKGLPPGIYTVAFDLSNFQPGKREDVALTVGGTTEVNIKMSIATRTEAVFVTAEAPSPVATVTSGQTFTKTELEALPVGRTPAQIAELAPGLTNDTPNVNQVTISGATAFDNVFLINGVDINDNLFGTAHNLFIEDAIQETNIMTGGISAEWGRFSGGVINMVTKSGGNTFSGSFRENLNNTRWIDETPRQKAANIQNPDLLAKSYEGTFGGPLVKDRLWFFVAGRYEPSDQNLTFILSDKSAIRHDVNKRGELKFTGTPASGHTIYGDYTNNATEQNNRFSLNSNSLDPSVLINETQPNSLFVTNYSGVIKNQYFATAQYSQKKFAFIGAGGTDTAITSSPIRTRGVTPGIAANLLYAAPFFSALDPESRDNHQFSASVSRQWSGRRSGTHDLKGGFEYYRSTHTGGNAQSATNYVFQADYLQSGGKPVYDPQGVPVPVWTPGVSRVQNWIPNVGAIVDINTTSIFVQDRWVAKPRLTVDLGVRFEAVRGDATGEIITVDTNKTMPRLGVAYDLQGDGRTVLQGTFGTYSGKYSEAQFASNTDVGNPSRVTYGYTGPAGQGRDFAPAYNLANYGTIISAAFPTANIFVADGVHSPSVAEFTVGVARELGGHGYVRATYQYRNWYDFLEDTIQLSNGIVNVNRSGANVGDLTKVLYTNLESGPKADREYQALIFQSTYRFRRAASFGAHWTLQLKNEGNSNAEAANQPGLTSRFGDYPEILGPAIGRYQPWGRLADYQRSKLRVYGTYTLGSGSRYGSVDISPLWRLDSGQTFSYFASLYPLTAVELARNPGYPANDINALTAYDLYFGDRGAGQFKGYGLLDLAVTYSVPIVKSLKPWLKVEFFNLLNNDKQIKWDTTVTADPNSPKDANGLPTGYIPGSNFGTAVQDNQFPQPISGTNGGRLFRMAFGIRF
jgi:hypothetical protein